MSAEVICGKCEEVLPTLGADSVDLILTDPPYFRVKGEPWDNAWDSSDAFLSWMGSIADEWKRVLKPNGSLFVFASPQMSIGVERVISERFNVLNVIRWYKEAGWHNKAEKETLRSFLTPWEGIVFAEQFGDQYADAESALHKKVYAPLGRVFAELRLRAGLERWQIDVACAPSRKPTGLCYRWEEGACLPTEEQYANLTRLCGDGRPYAELRREYEELREQYEELREQYEELRRPFRVSDRDEWSDLWRFGTVPPAIGKHPCEKPVALLEYAIRSTTRPGAVVLDTFAGSGATMEAARNLGRRAIAIEESPKWCRYIEERLSQQTMFLGEVA